MTSQPETPVPGEPVTAAPAAPTLVDAFTVEAFADYPVRYAVARRAFFLLCETPEEAQAEAAAWHPNDRPIPRRVRIAPDSQPVITAASESIHVRSCTSTRWVADADETIRNTERAVAALAGTQPQPLQQCGLFGTVQDPRVVQSQQWWLRGDAEAGGWDGFRIECADPVPAHEGPCGFGQWTWNWRTGRLSA